MRGLTFDVYYYEDFAHTAAILFETGENERIIREYTKVVEEVNPYVPGQFYKRELPCIMSILEDIEDEYDFLLVDSYVYIKEDHKGLGAYLYEKLDKRYPVVGLAKNWFRSAENYMELERGESKKKLYVTAAGLSLEESYDIIKNMKGDYRMPDILKRVDKLSRKELV